MVLAGESWLRAGATIEGSVKLPEPKPPAPIRSKYAGSFASIAGLPDPPLAVVYLEGDLPATASETNKVVQVAQKDLQFRPALLVIQKGTRIEFPNQDDEYHNVLSYSRAKEFDLGRYRKDVKAPSLLFDKPGVVELNCEIHDHMRGFVIVVETPYFTRTDANGRFKMENLPTGAFTLKIWVNPRTLWKKTVELKEGETVQVDFSQ